MLLAALLVLLQDPAGVAARRPLGWSDFPVFVWREAYAGKPIPAELVEPFGGVILMREEDSAWARERGLAYLVWNVAGRDALHLDADEAWNARVERWIQTHDESLLVRQPCLNDPATLARLFATLDATFAKHGEHPGLGFVLGDEVGLTPNGDPFDLCRCGFCEAKWREHAQKNRLPERAPLTDEVRLALLDDDFSLVGPWLARRRFDDEQLARALDALVVRARRNERCPDLGLLGCSDPTAFGTVPLESFVSSLDFMECYPSGSARQLVETTPGLRRHGSGGFSGRIPGPHAVSTVFVGDESAAGLAWCVWETWVRGGSSLVLWSDSSLESAPPESRARLQEAVSTVRALSRPESALPVVLRPLLPPRAAAVVRDEDSTALSFLRDARLDGATWPRRRAGFQRQNGTLERKVETWLRLLEDCGIRPGALTLAQVCSGCAADFGLLVLPEILALCDHDIAELEAYLDAGGTLVLDGTLGWVDRNGLPNTGYDVKKRLSLRAPGRVVEAPSSVASYLGKRRDSSGARSARRFVMDLPAVQRERADRRSRGLPAFEGVLRDVPWLVASFPARENALGLALLPNYCDARERREHLRDLSLEGLEAPEGFEIDWIHPSDGKVLRAGDAAVLLVERISR